MSKALEITGDIVAAVASKTLTTMTKDTAAATATFFEVIYNKIKELEEKED